MTRRMSTTYTPPKQPIEPGAPLRLGQAYGCVPALLLAERQQHEHGCTIVITATVAEAEALTEQINFFAGDAAPAILFPDPETLAYDAFSPHQDLVSRRLAVLAELSHEFLGLCVIAAPTLFYRLPPAEYIRQFSLQLIKGQPLKLEQLHSQLAECGYSRVSQVSQHGEFAVRGSLIDLFPMGCEMPIRVDFFDDEIDSIREFDPDSQISGAHVDSISMLPARDFSTDTDAIRQFRNRFRERFEGNPADTLIYTEVSEGRFPGGIENYLPLFFDNTANFWSYVNDDATVVLLGDVDGALTVGWQQITERFGQYRHDIERPALEPQELFYTEDEQNIALAARRQLRLTRNELADADNIAACSVTPVAINTHAETPAADLVRFIENSSDRVLIAAESPGRRELIGDMLRDNGISVNLVSDWQEFISAAASPAVIVAPLEHGARLSSAGITILAESELFGTRPTRKRKRKVRDPETILNDLTDLREGSPVVHIDYGVGRYRGISHLDIDGVANDFLTLEYADGDRLHVPVGSLQLISRYTGTTPENAPLHKLGSDQWDRARRKANEQIRDVAAEMLDLYATRAARKGRSYRVAPADYEAFSANFPFALTDDQATAIEASLEDLRSPQPMDRLVCGDVGFGKTEVALRAAFVAALSGGQVALLAPTTLLAQQHYQTFRDRFADWPINVEVLSRFRTARESREVIADLAAGKADIVIGTHKLLQEDIKFDNLGLVIVDEEHRFGVKQKERLKALRAEVDILTLTATPIPRTLNLALGELRELSLITTPPETRLSIKTFVTEWNDSLLQEACQRELKRGGQVFFVHNRIEDIEKQVERLARIIPDASIRIAHGQMPEAELEQIMLDFYHRRFHILACTAIIESGIDIPSANTIIINRADRFGLAQLHQLRGRVGRSHHKAFAYLLTPPEQSMTADARKRLDAIESMEDLGAGFVLATHDLEIRGAGELLGEQQTGQIQQIGFSLYTELLGRAVAAIRRGETPDLEASRSSGADVNLHVPALLPEDYLPDVQMRLVHYKRIASAADEQALHQLQVELIDRFGLLPDATRNLFRQTRLRLRATELGIRKFEGWPGGLTVEFAENTRADPTTLIRLIQDNPERYSFDSRQRLRVVSDLEDTDTRFNASEELLGMLAESSGNASSSSM